MTMYKEFRTGGSNTPFGFLGPLLILALFFAGLFFLAKGLFWLLSWVAPVFLILTLIIDYTVVKDFFIYIWKLLNEKPLMGVFALLVVLFGYPFVAGYLFVKALGKRSVKKVLENVEKERNTYTDYEEVEEDDDTFLELPPINKQPAPEKLKKSSEYDDMFK